MVAWEKKANLDVKRRKQNDFEIELHIHMSIEYSGKLKYLYIREIQGNGRTFREKHFILTKGQVISRKND